MMYTQNTQKKVTCDTKRKGSPGNKTIWLLGRNCHGDLLVAVRDQLLLAVTLYDVQHDQAGHRHSSRVYLFVNICI